MSANISTYAGREAAWHKLGRVTGHYMTWQEVLVAAQLDYAVFKSQLRDGLGRPVDAWGTFRWNRADQAVNNKEAAQFLGAVGADYKVIQHVQSFTMLDTLVEAQGGAHYETAGSLGRGEIVWGLVDLNMTTAVQGVDQHKHYLFAVTSHDGSYAHRYKLVNTRVVCQNTTDIALSESGIAAVVRHTKNSNERLKGAQKALEALRGTATSLEAKLNLLASRRMTRETLTAVMDRLFPVKQEAEGTEKPADSSTRRNNVLGEILGFYESNDQDAYPQFRGTAYNLLNAVTEYTDHARSTRVAAGSELLPAGVWSAGRRSEARAESALLGSGSRLKGEALRTILELTEDAPRVNVPVYVLPNGRDGGVPNIAGIFD